MADTEEAMDAKHEIDTRPHEHTPAAGGRRGDVGQMKRQGSAGNHTPSSTAPDDDAAGPEA